MNLDKKVKKDWFILSNGSFFNSDPRDDKEREFFDKIKAGARKYGIKVARVLFDKTEYEFYKRKL